MRKGYAIIHDEPTQLSINCEDFDVECFGGCDYEFTYTLDKPNRDKLRETLFAAGVTGSMGEMIKEYFGECLDKVPFGGFCDKHGICYDLFTWVS